MNGPRVVHVINSLSHRGGVMRGMSETLPRLNKLCGKHSILCLQEGGEWAREFEAAGVAVDVLPMVKPFRARKIPALKQWLREKQVDLLHLRMPETVLPAYFATLRGGVPYAIQGHGLWDEYWLPLNAVHRALHQRATRRAAALIAVSQTVADAFRADLGQPRREVVVISNGVTRPPADFDARAARRRVRNALGIAVDAPVAGLVGRPCKAKRHVDFVKAARIVLDRKPKARFLIVGHGKEKYVDKMTDAIERLDLKQAVLWVGDQSAIHDYIAAFDIGVLCSEREGFGLALVEYLEHGLPVVVSDIPAFREIVREGENGVFAEARNPESLAEQILRVMEDEALAKKLRENAKGSVERFSWDQTAEQMAEFYRGFFAARGFGA